MGASMRALTTTSVLPSAHLWRFLPTFREVFFRARAEISSADRHFQCDRGATDARKQIDDERAHDERSVHLLERRAPWE